jgi:hypothetical protein
MKIEYFYAIKEKKSYLIVKNMCSEERRKNVIDEALTRTDF